MLLIATPGFIHATTDFFCMLLKSCMQSASCIRIGGITLTDQACIMHGGDLHPSLRLSCRSAKLWSGVPFKSEGIDMVSSKDIGQTAEYQNNVVDLNTAKRGSLQKQRQQVMLPSNPNLMTSGIGQPHL